MARLTPGQRAEVREGLALARGRLAAGDADGAMAAAMAAHRLAMNSLRGHARVHALMLRAAWRRGDLGACRHQLTQTLLGPVATAARLVRGLEPGEPGGDSILGTLLGRQRRV